MTSVYDRPFYTQKTENKGLSPQQIKAKIEGGRQARIKKLVQAEYPSGQSTDSRTIDGRAELPIRQGAAAFAAFTGLGTAAALILQAHPGPAGPPTAGEGINPTGAPSERTSIPVTDVIGIRAQAAANEANGRSAAKKIDTSVATQANKFTDPETRDPNAPFNRGSRLDVRARAGQTPEYNQGGEIDGRGPTSTLGFRAPEIPKRMAIPQPGI